MAIKANKGEELRWKTDIVKNSIDSNRAKENLRRASAGKEPKASTSAGKPKDWGQYDTFEGLSNSVYYENPSKRTQSIDYKRPDGDITRETEYVAKKNGFRPGSTIDDNRIRENHRRASHIEDPKASTENGKPIGFRNNGVMTEVSYKKDYPKKKGDIDEEMDKMFSDNAKSKFSTTYR